MSIAHESTKYSLAGRQTTMNGQEERGIRLPGQLLEQIKTKEEKGEYDDSRYSINTNANSKKRKGPTVSRKDKRKQERLDKKQKKSKQKEQQQSKNTKFNDNKSRNGNHSKNNGKENNKKKNVITDLAIASKGPASDFGLRIIKEDELDDDEVSDLDFGSESDLDLDSDSNEIQNVDVVKSKSSSSKQGTTSDGFRIVKEDDLEDDELSDFDDFDSLDDDEDDKPVKSVTKKNNLGTKTEDGFRIVKEDDLEDDEFSDESLDFGNENLDDFEQEEANDSHSEEDDDENPLEKLRKLKEAKKNKSNAKDPLEQLRKLKEAKNKSVASDPMEQLRKIKEAKKAEKESKSESNDSLKKKAKKEKAKEKKEVYVRPMSARERELMERDEMDMAYYAKKLGLKNGKNSKLSKQDEYDDIGGLLDGLDFDFDDDNQYGEEEEDDDEEEVDVEEHDNQNGNEDFDMDDFGGDDDEFDEEELRELREMEALENSDNSDVESSGETHVIEAKENPYVAPGSNLVEDNESSSSGGYVPPHLRRKMALENSENSEEVIKINREIKGCLNRLSEANIATIISQINDLYLNNARQLVNESLTKLIMDSVLSQGRLNENLLLLQAALVSATHRTQGVEFGAYFIQALVEKLDKMIQDNLKNGTRSTESLNLVSLLSAVFSFQLVSSRILYDIVKLLIENLNEYGAELLLRLIQSSGNQMRSEDPSALKEMILLINKKSSEMLKINTRMQFLIETIGNLKNNKLKLNNENQQQLVVKMKKLLGGMHGRNTDPLQVSLDDIRSIESRGKWWLVGSAWKGNEEGPSKLQDEEAAGSVDIILRNDIDDVLDNAEPNWLELARSQRMNTDVRRAIFILIMSANDYMDAFTKLDKLGLKRAQEREIPRVLVHCASVEPSWNPYYGILATKLCDGHAFRKTLQFMFWDLVKEFEGGNADSGDSDQEDAFTGFDNDESQTEESKLHRIINLGRFFGFLIAESSLSLNVLRTVNLLTVRGDILIFVEILLVTYFDHIAKKSKTSEGKKSKKSKNQYDPKLITQSIAKAQEQPVLLRGIKYFVENKLKGSEFVSGLKQKARLEWGTLVFCNVVDEILKNEYSAF